MKLLNIKYILFFWLARLCFPSLAQNIVPYEMPKDWYSLGEYEISDNGKFVCYSINSEDPGKQLFAFSDITGSNKTEIKGGFGGKFTNSGAQLVFRSSKGVGIIDTKTRSVNYLENANIYKIANTKKTPWVVLSTLKSVLLYNINRKSTREFIGAYDSVVSPDGSVVVVCDSASFYWINLNDNLTYKIINPGNISSVTFSADGTQIAFFSNSSNGQDVFIYSPKNYLKKIASTQSFGKEKEITRDKLEFSKDGRRLFLLLHVLNDQRIIDTTLIAKDLKIWNYKDSWAVNGGSRSELLDPYRLLATISLKGQRNKLIIEDNLYEVVPNTTTDRFVIISTRTNRTEVHVDKANQPKYYILDFETGEKTLLPFENILLYSLNISPSGRYLTWKDAMSGSIMCYDKKTQATVNLTKQLGIVPELGSNKKTEMVYIDNWIKNDSAILIYDSHDIYMVDPNEPGHPIYVTNGYGKRNGIRFRVAEEDEVVNNIREGQDLLISGLIDSSSYNGIYSIKMGFNTAPRCIISPGPYFYGFKNAFVFCPETFKKARYSSTYLISQQSSNQSPNLYSLTHSGKLNKLSHITPEKEYKWLNSKLYQYLIKGGGIGRGILYTPQDLDTSKKYPVIFNYYESRAKECYKFIVPGNGVTGLYIPYFVSNGYLVFVPDIPNQDGNRGEAALNAVESAVEYLTANVKFIDKNRLGLQGHSFGGYVTNFIAMRSKLFSAAQSTSGLSDFLREYGEFGFGGNSLSGMCEVGQLNMQSTPWNNLKGYIDNSPFYFADSCSTPLLLAHGTKDGSVPISQAYSLFVALRRLGKPAWLLEYKDEGHIFDYNIEDFVFRQKQFFDYYLTGAKAPVWMVDPYPLKYQGVKSGLQLDSLNRTP